MEDDGEKDKKKKKRAVILNRDVVINKLTHRHKDRKPSPMVTLQEIFEETPDKGRFVGDTMFWKYFEDIDIFRVYHTNSVEYRNLRVMFYETCFYAFLLLMLTVYVYASQSREVFDAREEQVKYWGGCDDLGECRTSEVVDVNSFWHWMRDDLIPNAYTEYSDPMPSIANISTPFTGNQFPLLWSPRFIGPQMSSVVLGTVRLRQLRVEKGLGCEVSKLVGHVYPDCYGPYSTSYRSTRDYFPRFAPTYLRDAFTWKDSESTRQVSELGTMSGYGGDGFMVDLPFDRGDAATMINDLWNWNWVDRATRAVLIETTILNTNVNVIVNSRMVFEFSSTGSVVNSVKVTAARVFFFTPSLKSGAAINMFFLQLFLLLTFLAYTFYLFWLMYKTCHNFLGEHPLAFIAKSGFFGAFSIFAHTLYHYFQYIWNLNDLVILTLFYVHFGYRLETYLSVGREQALSSDVVGHPEVFMPFSRVLVPLTSGNNVLSLLAMFAWIKVFKYLCMSSYFRLLVRILEHCAARLVVFSALLLIVFFGFAVAFFVGFGGTEEAFSAFPGAFLVLFFLLIDGYDVNERWFQPGKDIFMPIIFFVYIAIVYFVILNVFVAVVLDVYATSEHNTRSEGDKPNPMLIFLKTYYNWMRGVSLVKDDTDEYLRSEDLAINLDLLPGIVRRKWIEKKRNMQRVASENFAGMDLFGEGDIHKEEQTITDWMLPSTRADVLDKMHHKTKDKPIAIYEVPAAMLKQEVSRSQLQRLMDEDSTLPLLLGTPRAVDVIRRFKAVPDPSLEDENSFEALPPVKALQGGVFAKIDNLEKVQFDEEDVHHVPEIDQITEHMSHSVYDVRDQFRLQLTSIIEATAVLFEHLVELTQGIETVRQNHEGVIEMVRSSLAQDQYAESSMMSSGTSPR